MAACNIKDTDSRENTEKKDKEINPDFHVIENKSQEIYENGEFAKGSFFRIDPEYTRKVYDPGDKVLPMSQPLEMTQDERNNIDDAAVIENNTNASCVHCKRSFKNNRGLNQHVRSCRSIKYKDFRLNKENDGFLNSQGNRFDSNHVSKEHTEVKKLPSQVLTESVQQDSTVVECDVETRTVQFWLGTPQEISAKIMPIYDLIVHWRKNLFKLPTGSAGKAFIAEMTRQINLFTTNSPLKPVALTCLMIMPQLLLQKPSRDSKAKDHSIALKKRIDLWNQGNLDELLNESRTIQNRLPTNREKTKEEIQSLFSKYMMEGKVNAAIRLLSDEGSKGVLHLSDEVLEELKLKHPIAEKPTAAALLQGPIQSIHNVIYENINGESIRKAALNTKGAAGPSGLDSEGWRRILVSRVYGKIGEELRNAVARLAKQLSTEMVQHSNISSPLDTLLACRLIPLDKSPGIRPIGIGEVLRRIIGKSLMHIIKNDVSTAAGSLQLCAGQPSGCEAVVHAVRSIFEEEECDAVILVDASNAFNSINRKAMLHNIGILCPAMKIFAENCYSTSARLFITGGAEIRSNEGTTQGDPISMALYAIALTPLLDCLISQMANYASVKSVAFADDLNGTGKLYDLLHWWKCVCEFGPVIGYFPKPSKSWLIAKSNLIEEARDIFKDTGINFTSDGKKHLGAAIGSEDFKTEFINEKVQMWVKEIINLTEIAKKDPHSAYCAFTHGLRNRYTYSFRTIPGIKHLLQPLENAIKDHFIPAITRNHLCNDYERRLLALPPKMGGLGIIIPMEIAEIEFENSCKITKSLQDHIILQDPVYTPATENKLKNEIKRAKHSRNQRILDEITSCVTEEMKLCLEIAQGNGASNWLTSLPIQEEGFHLNKREFWDAISLRYDWPIPFLPTICVCGKPFDVSHSLSCKKGGYVTLRHNEVRDITAEMLHEVCRNVSTEPALQPLTGENLNRSAITSDESRVDVSARDFWVRGQQAFFDVRVFNPFAKRHIKKSLSKSFEINEKEKKMSYNLRVQEIEQGSFTPLVFSTTGGMARECTIFYSRLAKLISEKRCEDISKVSAWVKTKINFSLIRSTLTCLRGSRTITSFKPFVETDIDIMTKVSALENI